jgi:hypothetical protein
MRQDIQRTMILAGLTLLGAMVATGREARATVSGITIKGGIVQDPNDPPYTYQFAIYLDGTILPPASATTSVTFTHLLGVGSGSQSLLPPLAITTMDQFGNAWTPTINQTQGPSMADPNLDYFSDVTWTYAGHHAIASGPNPLLLGVFEVTTVEDFAPGYPSALTSSPIAYSYSLNHGSTDEMGTSGTVTLQVGGVFTAPEPSTAIAVLWAIAGLPLLWLFRRKRLRRQPAS